MSLVRLPALARAALVLLTLAAAPALAEPPALSLSGFATLGVVHDDRGELDFYRPGVNRPGGDEPDFGADSLVAAQASLRLAEHTDATLQLMARESTSGNYDPRVTWAFLRHTVAPGLWVRAGRLRVPFMMLSDSLYVNYANPWVRPPVEVYGLNPFSDLNGADLLYQLRLGGFALEIHPYLGGGRISFPQGESRLRQVRGVNLALSGEALSLHLGHGEGRLDLQRGDVPFRSLVAALSALGRNDVVADLSGEDGYARFDSLGAQWDDGTWQLVGEYARRRADRYVTDAHGWYLTAGRRFGAFMPFVTLARQTQDRPVTDARVPQVLADSFDAFLASRNTAQRSESVGLRWDFRHDAAFKVQLDRAHVDADSWGSFFPRDPAGDTRVGGQVVHLLSVSVDVAF